MVGLNLRDKVSGFAVDFTNKVNSGNTFGLADASNIIADETQLLSNLTRDYLADKLANIPPATDTEDLTRFEILVKPNQLIKYLRNQIKNHNDKFPKEVQQLENKIDNSITKTTAKLTKIQADLEEIKSKYNITNSFVTNSFHIKDAGSSLNSAKTMAANIASTIESLATALEGNKPVIAELNKFIQSFNNSNNDLNDTENSALAPCNQVPKPNPIPLVDENEENTGFTKPIFVANSENCVDSKSAYTNSQEQPFYKLVLGYDFDRKSPTTGRRYPNLTLVFNRNITVNAPGYLKLYNNYTSNKNLSKVLSVTSNNQNLLLMNQSLPTSNDIIDDNKKLSTDDGNVHFTYSKYVNTGTDYYGQKHYRTTNLDEIKDIIDNKFNNPSKTNYLKQILSDLDANNFLGKSDNSTVNTREDFFTVAVNGALLFNNLTPGDNNSSRIIDLRIGPKELQEEIKIKLQLDKDGNWKIGCP